MQSFCRLQPKRSGTRAEPSCLNGPPTLPIPCPFDCRKFRAEWLDPGGRGERHGDFVASGSGFLFHVVRTLRKAPPVGLQRHSSAQGLQVVGLNVGGPDDRIKVAAFAAEFNIPYPLGFPDKPLSDLFLSDNDTIPQTFVFDRGGQLVKRFIGYDDSMPKELERVIQAALIAGSK